MNRVLCCAVACVLASSARADLTGYAQVRQVERTRSASKCAGVDGCSTMAQQGEIELLYERRFSQIVSTTLRVDAGYDVAISEDTTMVREAFVDWIASPQWNIRFGRQILTWGVSEFLYVNDIFPKNFDAFFAGANVDRIKEPVDALRLATQAFGTDLEIVVNRSRLDVRPESARFAGLSMLRGADRVDGSDDADAAIRASRYVGGWDLAIHLASLRSRDPRFFVSGAHLALDQPRTNHFGVSATGNFASGVLWFEAALRDVTSTRSAVVDRYFLGSSTKSIVGYSRELGADATATLQLQFEQPLHRSRYRRALAPGIRSVDELLATFYLRLERRWKNQTIRAGLQSFIGNEGDVHLNPFAMLSPADGWTLEGGANVLTGRADTRFGSIKNDSNVYALVRYSF